MTIADDALILAKTESKIVAEGPAWYVVHILHLAKGLATNTCVKELVFNGNNFGLVSAQEVAELIKVNKSITSLTISHNELTSKEFEPIAAALAENTTIKRLNFSYTKIGSAGVYDILKALDKNTTINELCLDNLDIRSDVASLASLLKVSTLAVLIARGNNFTNLTNFAARLETNTTLVGLNLDNSNPGGQSIELKPEHIKKISAAIIASGNKNILGVQSATPDVAELCAHNKEQAIILTHQINNGGPFSSDKCREIAERLPAIEWVMANDMLLADHVIDAKLAQFKPAKAPTTQVSNTTVEGNKPTSPSPEQYRKWFRNQRGKTIGQDL